jgi:glutamate dehydrogenase/leucine dehydrogenase
VKITTINIIGQGNVAFHYHKIMKERGYEVKTISSRKEFVLQDVKSDIVIIAVKDDAIKLVLDALVDSTYGGVKEMSEMYQVDEDTILKEVSLENIKFDLMYQKALDLVTANKEEK